MRRGAGSLSAARASVLRTVVAYHWPPRGRQDAASVQLCRDGMQADDAFGPDGLDDRQHLRCADIGRSPDRGDSGRVAAALERMGAVRVAELGSARLGCRERRLGPLRDHFTFVLGNRGEDVNGQPVRHRHIGRDER